MFPGSYRPTPVHFFVALLAQKQLLLRNYTQNIDTLERVAGVPPELLVEAHGEYTHARALS
jgi:NAD-dependent SIR2 family protein deacetylase